MTNCHQTITNLQPVGLFLKYAFASLQREVRMMAAGFPLGVCLNVLLYTLTGKSYLCVATPRVDRQNAGNVRIRR